MAVAKKLQTPKAAEIWVEKLLRQKQHQILLEKSGKSTLTIPIDIGDVFPMLLRSSEDEAEEEALQQHLEELKVRAERADPSQRAHVQQVISVLEHQLQEQNSTLFQLPALMNGSLTHDLKVCM
jgi:GTP:adenosylcobinamide-phosphate guanylyltransferase